MNPANGDRTETIADAGGATITSRVIAGAGELRLRSFRAKDLYTDFLHPAFRLWPAPNLKSLRVVKDCTSNTNSNDDIFLLESFGSAIWPNYRVADTRGVADCYPGPALTTRATPNASNGEAADDAGKDLDTDQKAVVRSTSLTTATGYGRDPWSGWQFAFLPDLSKKSRGGTTPATFTQASVYAVLSGWTISSADDKTWNAGTGNYAETPMPFNDWAGPSTAADTAMWGYSNNDYRTFNANTVTDSYWNDILTAFGAAMSVMRAHWVDADNEWIQLASSFPSGKLPRTDLDSIEEFDRLFLSFLGESLDAPGSDPQATWQIRTNEPITNAQTQFFFVKGGYTPNNNLHKLKKNGLLKRTSGAFIVNSSQRSRLAEMVLNDFRMNLFGASPDYPGFRPLDLDGDGYAVCSAYRATVDFAASSDAEDPDSGSANPAPTVKLPAMAANASHVGPAPDWRFSLTGCLFIGKSRFYRVISRGELWDTVLARPVSSATAENVVCIDGNGDGVRTINPATRSGFNDDLQVIFQKWHWDRYNGERVTLDP